MNCKFKSFTKGTKCSRCGYILKKDYPGPVVKLCTTKETTEDGPLLGDCAERYLEKLGVTPENYSHAKEALGLLPDCNCKSRKRMLNEIHAHAKEHGWLSALSHARQISKNKE